MCRRSWITSSAPGVASGRRVIKHFFSDLLQFAVHEGFHQGGVSLFRGALGLSPGLQNIQCGQSDVVGVVGKGCINLLPRDM